MKEVKAIIDWMNANLDVSFETDDGLVGGSAYDAYGVAISKKTWPRQWQQMLSSSAQWVVQNGPAYLMKPAPKPRFCVCARIWPVCKPASGAGISGSG